MGVYAVKQLIIIRKDLGMNKGKLAAQAAHASMGTIIPRKSIVDGVIHLDFNDRPEVIEWFTSSFAKIALAVNSEAELLECIKLAKEHNLLYSYIVDNGTTVFNGVPTPTCVGIGPAKSEVLDALFGNLKLY